MTNFKSFKEIAEPFWSIEKEYQLLSYTVNNVYIWQVVRMEVFSLLCQELLGLGGFHLETSSFHKIKSLLKMLYHSIINNPIFSKQSDIVIFPHDRVVSVDSKYIDIYTKYLVDKLIQEKKNILVLEKPYGQIHYVEKENYIKYLDYSILLNFFKSKIIKQEIELDENFVTKVEEKFFKVFNVNIDLKNIFYSNLQRFENYYKYYYNLFIKIRPKQIYLVVSYAYPWVIKAAKDLDIEVIELQHGTFSKYHLGYSYPYEQDKVQYFPDKFLVWNQYWKDLISLPIEYQQIEVYPFEFQKKEIEKYKNVQKRKGQVVVLSQGPISNMLAKVLLDNFDFFKDKIVKYKLHPGEFKRYKSYEYLNRLAEYDNVEILLKSNLYEVLAESEYQVGVSSTALYEGVKFGLKTILVDLPSVEYMEKLIEMNKIEMMLYEKK